MKNSFLFRGPPPRALLCLVSCTIHTCRVFMNVCFVILLCCLTFCVYVWLHVSNVHCGSALRLDAGRLSGYPTTAHHSYALPTACVVNVVVAYTLAQTNKPAVKYRCKVKHCIAAPLRVHTLVIPPLGFMLATRKPIYAWFSTLRTGMFAQRCNDRQWQWHCRRNLRCFIRSHGHAFSRPWSLVWGLRLQHQSWSHSTSLSTGSPPAHIPSPFLLLLLLLMSPSEIQIFSQS